MDIIECLVNVGSAVVNSMILSSERYSKNDNLSLENRQYYKEFNECLVAASNNLEDYRKKEILLHIKNYSIVLLKA